MGGRGWIAPIAALPLLLLPALLDAPARGADSAEPAGRLSPRLTIDYGDGVEKTFTRLPWKEGTTVLDLLEAASKHPRGIKFRALGSGETAFVREIDGLRNEGGGADSRNWLFKVNSQLADVGCGACRVGRDDEVLWRYSTGKPD